jgi:AcrR family transcriptional regulator
MEATKINQDKMAITRRHRKREAQRARIRDAALYLFETQGFERTTVEHITERSDVAKGTFFNYFPTKQSVLADYYTRLSTEFLNAARKQSKGAILQRFARLFEAAETMFRREGRMAEI